MSTEIRHSGRPSEYDSTYAERFLEFAKQGLSIMEIAAKLEKSRDTVYRWAKEIQEFGDAFRMGKEWSEAKNAEMIKLMALGGIPKGNVAAYQMYMRNTAGWDKFVNANGSNQTININQMNVLNDKSTKELLEYISSSTEDLKDVLDITEFKLIEDGNREPNETGVTESSPSS